MAEAAIRLCRCLKEVKEVSPYRPLLRDVDKDDKGEGVDGLSTAPDIYIFFLKLVRERRQRRLTTSSFVSY